MNESYSLYLHIPFCRKRCNYCDFITYAGKEEYIPDYIRAMQKEIEFIADIKSDHICLKSIYFGGGTPSLISVGHYERLFGLITKRFQVDPGVEISMEVNPGTLINNYLDELASLGVNRLSIGMQSANDKELAFLGRIHHFEDVKNTFNLARKSKFSNINLDLIFGLPGQSIKDWKNSIDAALSMKPEHLSIYSLTIETDTPFGKMMREGNLVPINDDLAAEMYIIADAILKNEGLEHYEISNWARFSSEGKQLRSIHNMQYWLNDPYIGIGAGAHSCYDGRRLENTSSIEEYLHIAEADWGNSTSHNPANKYILEIDPYTSMQETMMLGLRLIQEGVDLIRFENKHGIKAEKVFLKEIHKLLDRQLVEYSDNEQTHLRLTNKGVLLANQAFIEFVGKKK